MNFTEQIKAEILSKPIKENHCKIAFIVGLIRGSGVLYEREGELGLEFKVPDEQTAMMVVNTFSQLFNYEIREVSVTEDVRNNKDKFCISISGSRSIAILKELGILLEDEQGVAVDLKFYGKITKKDCCLRAFFRGLFISSGRCVLPTKNDSANSRYLLEIYFSHYSPAYETCQKLAENRITTRVLTKRGGQVVYIRSAEDIKDFVAFLPAPISVLKITDLMINRELANKINRQKNCDLGNVNKQVEAVMKLVNAIKKIDAEKGLDYLKADLAMTARARVDYPDDTMSELAQRLNITKSCLNHRLRKIVLIANEL